MGNFYQSVHIRTTDEAAAHAALNAACTGKKLRWWVSPLINGWVSCFPNELLEVSAACLALSKALPAVIVRMLVHDSDIFGYAIYRGGREEDEFASNPDYFKEASEAERRRAAGDPEKLRPLLGGPDSWERLIKLRKERLDWDPETQMAELMKLLGISNGLSSYKYLEEGDEEAVNDWEKFVHIPDLTAEKEARKKERARIRLRKQALATAGLLIFDRDLVRSKAFDNLHVLGSEADGDGFLVDRAGHGKDVYRWQPPSPPVPAPEISREAALIQRNYPGGRIAGAQSTARHPTQPLLLATSQRQLCLVDANSGKMLKKLEVLNPLLRAKKIAQWRASGSEPDERYGLEREDLLCCTFSPEGDLVFAGTTEGLRIYRFNDILAATATMPPPIGGCETSVKLQDYRWVHSLIVHAASHSIMYPSGDETIRRFYWITGEDREFAPAIGLGRITTLRLSRDGKLLACSMRGPLEEPRQRDTFTVRVWSFPSLLARAGNPDS